MRQQQTNFGDLGNIHEDNPYLVKLDQHTKK